MPKYLKWYVVVNIDQLADFYGDKIVARQPGL
jgi:hypothetical protein